MDTYRPGVSVAATRYMIKWDNISQQLVMSNFKLNPSEEINVFINFESVLRNLSLQKYVLPNIRDHKQDFVIEVESAALNLMAHYRSYLKRNNCRSKIYYYYTDLTSDEPQQMEVYNRFYRSFYKNHYMEDPKFRDLGILITEIVIPEIELITSYVPDCYFLKSKTFDSSIIPLIIANQSQNRNIIVTGDVFDTLYMFDPNFLTLYVKNRFQHYSLNSTIEGTVQSIIKDQSPYDINIYNSELYFRLLLAVKGSKIRNIKAAKQFGYGTLTKTLKDGIDKGIVLQSFSSLDSIIDLFNPDIREDLKRAFMCTSINTQYEMISDIDINIINDQIVDKMDIGSLEVLNNKRFFDYPINLSSLIY